MYREVYADVTYKANDQIETGRDHGDKPQVKKVLESGRFLWAGIAKPLLLEPTNDGPGFGPT